MEEMEDQTKTDKEDWKWMLFSFKGRISRKPFWIFNLIVFSGAFTLSAFTEPAENIYELTRPQIMFMLWILWPSLAVQAKRWHDRNKSALWIAINFIPYIGPVFALIENGFFPGTSGENQYGPDPLEESQAVSS